MKTQAVNNVLSGDCSVDEMIRIQGWIRTRRDSKRPGFSFLGVHDGSCFAPLKSSPTVNLKTIKTEVKKLTTGCAVEVQGTVKASQGGGQQYELLANEEQGGGLGR